MKSISTDLVNEFKRVEIHVNNFNRKDRYMLRYIEKYAKAHALTCKTILNPIKDSEILGNCTCNDAYFVDELIEWCENEIKILKDGGLI